MRSNVADLADHVAAYEPADVTADRVLTSEPDGQSLGETMRPLVLLLPVGGLASGEDLRQQRVHVQVLAASVTQARAVYAALVPVLQSYARPALEQSVPADEPLRLPQNVSIPGHAADWYFSLPADVPA